MAGIDLVIEPGQRVLLAGPSGAGKTTLLHALVGALGTTVAGEMSGRVIVDGRVGLLLQNPADAVVAERIGRDVAFGPENLGLPREAIWARVDAALDAVALPYGRHHLTSALSGGELQRLALAGTLALEPGLLLLDEPTSMLDDDNARSVREAVAATVERTGATLVVVEHRIEPWLDLVDRVVVLSAAGEIAADLAPAAFVARHRDDLGAAGVWMPGLGPPTPIDVASTLVRPDVPPPTLTASDLNIDLRSRTLRGTNLTHAVRRLDAQLAPGELTAFTGPSGAGKSTALAAFAGLLKPSSGQINGVAPALHSWKSRKLAGLLGWVPQNPEHGFLAQTVHEESIKTADHLGTTVDADSLLELFGLTHLAGANPYRLSGGEQRRLALLAALAHRPGIMLLDEPTVGQDRNTWAAVAGFLTAAASAGAAVGIATHDDLLVDLVDVNIAMIGGCAR